MAAVLRDKQPGGLPLDGGCDEDRARLGGALDPRGDIGRVAEHFAGRVHYHLPGIEADPRRKLRGAFTGVSGVDFDKRALDRERGAHRALGVVLLRVRIAEQRHQPVAELFQHMAAEPGHRRRGLVEIGAHEITPVLGVELCGHARGPDEVTEHDGDRAALGGRTRRSGPRRLGGGFRGPESGDGLEETLAVPQRHAELTEVAVCQIGQDFSIDFALAKRGLILTETEAAQPSPNVHDCIRPAGMMGLSNAHVQGIGLVCALRTSAAASSYGRSPPKRDAPRCLDPSNTDRLRPLRSPQLATFLGAAGDPYAKVGLDSTGRAGVDWGVYRVPETLS